MLVNRRTFVVKKPHFDEALTLLAEYRDLLKQTGSMAVMRVYAIEIGRFDEIACELETASLSSFERALAEFEEHPGVSSRLPSMAIKNRKRDRSFEPRDRPPARSRSLPFLHHVRWYRGPRSSSL